MTDQEFITQVKIHANKAFQVTQGEVHQATEQFIFGLYFAFDDGFSPEQAANRLAKEFNWKAK